MGSILKANARRLIFINVPKIFFVSIIFILINSVLSELAFRLPGSIDAQNIYNRLAAGEILSIKLVYDQLRPEGIILAILLYIFRSVFNIGYMSYSIKIIRGEDCGYKDIFYGFQFFLKCISLYIVITVLVFLWSILLIIPGIVASYRYILAYYILLDDPGKGVLECIRESMSVMRGRKLDLFLIDLSFIGWVILDVMIAIISPLPFALPIVLIWLEPYRSITYAGFYEQRRNELVI